MQNIFGSGVATGRFAMGSTEAFGPADNGAPSQEPESIDVPDDAPAAPTPTPGSAGTGDIGGSGGHAGVKRKRNQTIEEDAMRMGLTTAVNNFAAAVREGTPDLYRAVMDRNAEFSKAALMHCLNYLMKNKGTAEGFMDMDDEDKDFWLRDHLFSTNFNA
ncbi:unnamed protein product [Urochloa humidicola]